MKKASKSQIEAAAKAIMLLVPLGGNMDIVVEDGALKAWTANGRARMEWPKHFCSNERKLIRLIAKKALEAK